MIVRCVRNVRTTRKRRAGGVPSDWFAARVKIVEISKEEAKALRRQGWPEGLDVEDTINVTGNSLAVINHPGCTFAFLATYRPNPQNERNWGPQIRADHVRRCARKEITLESIIADSSIIEFLEDSECSVKDLSNAIWDAFGKGYVTQLVRCVSGEPGVRLQKKANAILEATGLDMDDLRIIAEALCVVDDVSRIRIALPSLKVGVASALRRAIVSAGCDLYEFCDKLADEPYRTLSSVWYGMSRGHVVAIDEAIRHDLGASPSDRDRLERLVELGIMDACEKIHQPYVNVGFLMGHPDAIFESFVSRVVDAPKDGYTMSAFEFVSLLNDMTTTFHVGDNMDAPIADHVRFVHEQVDANVQSTTDRFWPVRFWRAAMKIVRHMVDEDLPYVDEFDGFDATVDAILDDYERKMRSGTAGRVFEKFTLDESQRAAVRLCVRKRVSVICGGPGCGKTVVADCVAYVRERLMELCEASSYDAMAPLTQACAVSGKACSVLRGRPGALAIGSNKEAQLGGGKDKFVSVRTIASFLHGNGMDPRAGLLVVDESSMVSLEDMAALMTMVFEPSGDVRVSPDAAMVLVGDEKQLPSIGLGQVLFDMLTSGLVPSVRLEKAHRLDSVEGIGLSKGFAQARHGDVSALLGSNRVRLYPWLGAPEDPKMVASIVDSYLEEVDAHDGDMSQVMLVAPLRRLVSALNEEVASRVSAGAQPLAVMRSKNHDVVFHVGDRVVCLKNDYEKMLYYENGIGRLVKMPNRPLVNGDVGFIERLVPGDDPFVWVVLDAAVSDGSAQRRLRVRVPVSEFERDEDKQVRWSHGWAVTVHKSQGSEAESVLYAFPPVANGRYVPGRFYTQSLGYTAITRAKTDLSLFTNMQWFEACMKNDTLASSPLVHLACVRWDRAA